MQVKAEEIHFRHLRWKTTQQWQWNYIMESFQVRGSVVWPEVHLSLLIHTHIEHSPQYLQLECSNFFNQGFLCLLKHNKGLHKDNDARHLHPSPSHHRWRNWAPSLTKRATLNLLLSLTPLLQKVLTLCFFFLCLQLKNVNCLSVNHLCLFIQCDRTPDFMLTNLTDTVVAL